MDDAGLTKRINVSTLRSLIHISKASSCSRSNQVIATADHSVDFSHGAKAVVTTSQFHTRHPWRNSANCYKHCPPQLCTSVADGVHADSDTDADLAYAIVLRMEDAESATGKAHLTLPITTTNTKPKPAKTAAKTVKTEEAAERREVGAGARGVRDQLGRRRRVGFGTKPRLAVSHTIKAKPRSTAASTRANVVGGQNGARLCQ
ncbi:hypothetical protein B0H19DRAFT_1079285 [Mycena capillaripes]|nr:hypothetical protein B0H19DRAFT_1079285 [Mycena capillaripes]